MQEKLEDVSDEFNFKNRNYYTFYVVTGRLHCEMIACLSLYLSNETAITKLCLISQNLICMDPKGLKTELPWTISYGVTI